MEFKSQLCTTREQSERLLSMGLKRETADCYYLSCDDGDWFIFIPQATMIRNEDIPAWSLDRLIEMRNDVLDVPNSVKFYRRDNHYENIIKEIEYLIAMRYFNPEYLEERVWKG